MSFCEEFVAIFDNLKDDDSVSWISWRDGKPGKAVQRTDDSATRV